MEGGLDMATRKRLANRFKAEYARGVFVQWNCGRLSIVFQSS